MLNVYARIFLALKVFLYLYIIMNTTGYQCICDHAPFARKQSLQEHLKYKYCFPKQNEEVLEAFYEETKKIVDGQYIQLNEVLVRDVTLPATIKEAIERKLKQEQESLEYEFRLVTAKKEAQKVTIEAQGKADANRILSASLTDKILQDKGIDATLELAKSPNSKVVIVGGGEAGLPLILGNN